MFHPWTAGGPNRCFLWTLTSVISTFLSVVSLVIYAIFLSRNSRRVDNRPNSCRFIVQMFLSVVTALLVLVHSFLYTIDQNGGANTTYGFLLVYVIGMPLSWSIVSCLLVVERKRLCPKLYTRTHGFPLLLFWTINFVLVNLPLSSIGNRSWWWKMDSYVSL